MDPLSSNFRKISWSNLFAQFSEQVALAAAPLAAVLLLGAGPSETAWLQTSQTLSFLLLSIPLGLIVDRTSRRKLMMGAELIRAISLTVTFLFLVTHTITFELFAILGFLGAVGTVVYSIATPAYVPTIIPKDKLVAANRWLELARSVAFAGGPAIGGAIVAYIGASMAYIFATVFSIFAFMLLMCLPEEVIITKQKKISFKIWQNASYLSLKIIIYALFYLRLYFSIRLGLLLKAFLLVMPRLI